MERRRFIVNAGGVLAATGAAAVVDAPHVIAQPKFQWRMPSVYPPAADVLLGSAQRLAKAVDEMSGGRFRIEVSPAGQLMPPLGVFDAASQGTIEAFHAASLFWAAKVPAAPWFTTVPFGLNAEGMAAWFLQGDGLKLWEETYAPFNLVPRPGMSTGPQMAGWFRKKINTIADYKGLKMRIPGLGGQIVTRAGGTAVLTPGGEIYAALERGVIDASEWIGPYDDMKLGLHETARYYYYPGWHEPGATLEFVFNKKAYEALPLDLQRMLDHAAATAQLSGLMEMEARNAIALEKLKTEFKGKVEIVQFPAPVLRDLKKLGSEVVREESEKSPIGKKVYASFTKFQAQQASWSRISEGTYYQYVAL
ncbi:MAG TPA: ABC transporter substrate-binding protein [Methylomirabilota bacterium]|jgi:TRAP-type mannitol/chloroaromatic compound transport system substrate-binding protein